MMRKRQGGVAVVEMVITTPLLLLLLLGISELGKGFVQYNTLTKSVREGARHATKTALLGTTGTVLISPQLEAETRNLVVYGNVNGTGQPQLPAFAVDHVSVRDAGNELILVQADYPYQPLFSPVLETFGYGPDIDTSGVALTASILMRAL